MQLTIGRWDKKNQAGGSDMNFQGPISQRHFLYVGYTYLEWRLTPLGLNTPHTAAAQLMKRPAYFIGHMLFIYIYYPLQLCFPFLHLSPSPVFASMTFHLLILVLFFPPLPSFSQEGKEAEAFPYSSIYHHIKVIFFECLPSVTKCLVLT